MAGKVLVPIRRYGNNRIFSWKLVEESKSGVCKMIVFVNPLVYSRGLARCGFPAIFSRLIFPSLMRDLFSLTKLSTQGPWIYTRRNDWRSLKRSSSQTNLWSKFSLRLLLSKTILVPSSFQFEHVGLIKKIKSKSQELISNELIN